MYTFFADPGHGWLAVPRAEIAEMGLGHAISSYSYINKHEDIVYLEEDGDMSTYLNAKCGVVDADDRAMRLAKVGEWWKANVVENNSNFDSPIRDLPRFKGV